MAQTQARAWVESLAGSGGLNQDLNHVRLPLSDCVKLYSESEFRVAQMVAGDERNYTDDDARTWLSGVLENHRTCFDGLSEKGLDGDHEVARNLTVLLGKSLAFYSRGRSIRRGVPKRPRPGRNEGILTSWSPTTSKADYVVAKDGSGTHKSVNDAIAALGKLGKTRTQRIVVHVKAGVYNEKVEIGHHIKNVMLVGDGIDRTIVTGSRNVPDGYTTLTSATFGVSGDGFWARDITFENTAGPAKHQAVALKVSSDHSVFYRCSFKAYQDTLYAHSLRQFYRDCHIYGTVDFIFGDASAVFQNCDIFVRRPMSGQANYITAQGRDNPNENTGICIQRSRVRPSPEFLNARKSIRSYLGRPWRKYSRTVFMQTDLDGIIDSTGWGPWHGNYALSTLFYAEYKNTGNRASMSRRVNWPGFHVLNTPRQAMPFTVSRFIQGEAWIPATGVPFWLEI